MAPELKLAKKVTSDREKAGPSLSRIVVEIIPEVEPSTFYVFQQILRLTVTLEVENESEL